MKKTLKLIAVMLVLAMTLVMVPAFTVSAEGTPDANTILVGAGQTYTLISEAITGLKTDIVGKTLKLTSDITEPSSIKFDLSAITDAVTIDGDGHTLTLNSAFIAIDSALTIKNMKFTQKAANHPVVYARGNSDVKFIDCVTDGTFDYVFALNTAGNCNITVESGYYQANQKIFNIDMYSNVSKTKNVVTVNGGTFVATDGNVANVSAYTDFDINGGTFISLSKAPMILDTKVYLKDNASAAAITVSGATFIVPAESTSIFAETVVESVASSMTADNTNKVYAVIADAPLGSSYYGGNYTTGTGFPVYEDKNKTYAVVDDGLTPATALEGEKFATAIFSNGAKMPVTEALYATAVQMGASKIEFENASEGAFGVAYFADGTKAAVNAKILPLLDNSAFDGTIISLTADTDVTVDFKVASIGLVKNGKNAPNITSSNGAATIIDSFTTNFSGNTPLVQTKDAGGSISLRVIVPVASLAYSKAGVVWTKGTDASVLKYNNLGKYAEGVAAVETTEAYSSVIAGEVTYEAVQLEGNALVIITIDGLAVGDTITFKAYGITSAGAEYSASRTITLGIE
ncbi:MAG: hypothetical protein E7653_03995 [Ruminococcaceae bacterium]|nr:hypothetical protein [Oscillospiraceae bacterium]